MLAGKPLIAYSIEHAQHAKSVTRIIVSTDDAEIRRVALDYGAEVIDRPAEYAQDTSPDIDTFYHALNHLRNENYTPELVVHLRPTMPIRLEGDIDKAVAMLAADENADSLRSVARAKQSIFKMWWCNHEHYMTPVYQYQPTEMHSQPRQVLPQFYHQTGYIDVIRARTILECRQMAGIIVIPFYSPELPTDLDYLEDLPALEAMLKAQETRGERYAV